MKKAQVVNLLQTPFARPFAKIFGNFAIFTWRRGLNIIAACHAQIVKVLFVRALFRRRLSTKRGHRRRHGLEQLEPRLALTTNFAILDAYLMNGAGQRTDTAIIGQRIAVRFEYQTVNLPAGASYTVAATVDGVTRERVLSHGAGMSQGSWWDGIGGWFVQRQDYEITVEINPDRAISETSYGDNAFSFVITPVVPPTIFSLGFPLDAVPHHDVTIGGYIDLDNGPGVQDYRGGKLAYNGHEGIDINPLSLEQIDAGLRVVAPADGVVTRAVDGFSDFGGDGGSNVLEIYHGDGLSTAYGHLRRDSIRVSVGQPVTRGETVAYMGGSKDGIPHLHFEVKYNGRELEPNLLPKYFWDETIQYPLDVKSVLEIKSTNYDWTAHEREGSLNFSPVSAFIQGHPNSPRFVVRTNGIVPDDELHWKLYRPNGSLYASWRSTRQSEPEIWPHTWMAFNPIMPALPDIGEWRLAIEINGTELGEHFVRYVDEGLPVVRVQSPDGLYLHPNRYRPFVLESEQATFSVINHGTAEWNLQELVIPDGFQLVESLPMSIGPGDSGAFVVAIDPDWVGHAVGQIEIFDGITWAGQQPYRFSIEKPVSSSAVAQLVVGVSDRNVLEEKAFSVNVIRRGDLSELLEVSFTSSLDAALALPDSFVFLPGESYKRFDTHVRVNELRFPSGGVRGSIAASGHGYASAMATISVFPRENQRPEFSIFESMRVAEGSLSPQLIDDAITEVGPGFNHASNTWKEGQSVLFSIAPVSVPVGLMTELPTVRPDALTVPWPGSASLAIFPAPHAFGTAVYEITATDDDPLDPRSTIQWLTVTIDPVNDPPVAFERTLTVREAVEADDETAVLEFTAADLITGGPGETPNRPADLPPSVPPPFDESEQTLRVVAFLVPGQPAVDAADLPGGSGTVKRTLPSSGEFRFLFADGEFVSGIYTPPVNFNEHPVFGGPDTFRYIIKDDGKTTIPGGDGVPVFLPPERSQPATVTLRVLPANDPPQFTPGDELLIGHDRAAYAAPWATDVLPGPPTALDELAEQTVEFELTIPEHGRELFTAEGLPTLGGDGVLRFTAAPLAHGQVVIDVVAVDSLGARSQPVELTITLADILDPPLVSDDRVGTYRGDPLEIDLLAGAQATTAEIDRESIEIVIEPVAGELLILRGGRVRYVAAANAAGEDHFSYRISDIEGRVSESAAVKILLATSPLQNPLRYGDVNTDGNLTPLDALLILNRLAQAQREGISGGVPVELVVDESPRFFYDTDGNGRIEPLDALLVLNQIARNNRQNRAEGLVFTPAWESAMRLTPSTPTDDKTIGHPLDSPAEPNTAEPSVDWNVATIDQLFERLDYSDEESRRDQASDQLDLWVGLLSTEPRTIIPA